MSHARLSPSNHRWVHCPGSVREEAVYPDVPGEPAIDGTGSHLLLQLSWEEGKAPADYVGTIIGVDHEDKPSGWLVCEERARRVQMAHDYLKRRTEELTIQYLDCDIEIESETRSDPGSHYGRADWNGTSDLTIRVIDPSGVVVFVEVADYKDGRDMVSVNGNPQLIAYLGGKIKEAKGVKKCRMGVIQPKTNPAIRYEDMDGPVLLALLDDLAIAAAKTDDPEAPLASGTWCKWCKHKPNCKASVQNALAVMGDEMQLIELTHDIKSVDSTKLAELAEIKDDLVAAFEKIEAEIKRRVTAGQEVSFGDHEYRMMPGNKSRVWNQDEEEIYKVLKARRLTKDQIYPAKLISVAQALAHPDLSKQQKEKLEAEYVTEVAGKPVLKKVVKKARLPSFM